jgi:hypothetical protein
MSNVNTRLQRLEATQVPEFKLRTSLASSLSRSPAFSAVALPAQSAERMTARLSNSRASRVRRKRRCASGLES